MASKTKEGEIKLKKLKNTLIPGHFVKVSTAARKWGISTERVYQLIRAAKVESITLDGVFFVGKRL